MGSGRETASPSRAGAFACRVSVVAVAVLALVTAAASAQALTTPDAGSPFAALVPVSPGQKAGNPVCLKPTEETKEIYGPTDIGGTVGNGRLSVAVNPEGTLSVMRWPSPSYYEQLKYVTVDRELPRFGLQPNEGAFSGLALRLRDGSAQTLWLRDLEIRQRYASADSDTLVTRFRSPRHRLLLEIDDVVPPDADVLLRRHVLRLGRRSPVRSARLIAFANLNPTASKTPYFPTEDWCEEERGTDIARYDSTNDALVYEIDEFDETRGERMSVAVAIGASRRSDGHHVGADHFSDHPSTAAGPQSAYSDAEDGRLSGGGRVGPAEADAALSVPLGRRPVTIVLAHAATAAGATALLDRFRGRDPVARARAKRRSYLRWLRRAPLPADSTPAMTRLAKRALISLRQAIDRRAGVSGRDVAIVASIATQAPYGQDWIRDGAFFNEALEEIGHGSLVERHNAFYAEVQKKLEDGAPPGSPATTCFQPTPAGNWFMTNYADGGDAGIIPWEIDETAFGLWTLWRHFERRPAERRAYLELIYPAIRRAAEFLVAFRDPVTKLPPGTACEDDNPPQPENPTMHSAAPVLMAMRAAVDAAQAVGRTADAERYQRRVTELEVAIDARYRTANGAWTSGFGVGGWALWPATVKPDHRHPRMRAQAEAAWQSVAPSFLAPDGPRTRGQYEAKALLGLAHHHRALGDPCPPRVKRGLRWIAEVQAAHQGTGILGEVWFIRDGQLISGVSQPHVWAQVLFYLAAVEACGRTPYRAGAADRLLGASTAPGRSTPRPRPPRPRFTG